MLFVRRTGGPEEAREMWTAILSLQTALAFSAQGDPVIGNGGTAGRLRTTVAVPYRVGGIDGPADLPATDDRWDFSAEAAVPALRFRAYWLEVNLAGTTQALRAGTEALTEGDALRQLPLPEDDRAILGVYVAGPGTSFVAALVAQGTVFDGLPEGAFIGVVGADGYRAPQTYHVIRA